MFKWRQAMIIKRLNDLREGETGTIISILGKPAMHRYLYENGLAVGCRISVTKVEPMPMESLVTLKAGNRLFTLGKFEAFNIRVEVPVDVIEPETVNLNKGLVQA